MGVSCLAARAEAVEDGTSRVKPYVKCIGRAAFAQLSQLSVCLA